MLWPKKELFWAFLKLSTIPANLSREIKVFILIILSILHECIEICNNFMDFAWM